MARPFVIIISVLLGLLSSPCSSPERDKRIPIGPDVPASLVIYFRVGVTDEQINNFSQKVLSKPYVEGYGADFRDGICRFLRVFPPVQDHEAIAITFCANVTQAQRAEIKAAVMSSPLVYQVLENVAPKDVKNLDQ